MDQIIIQCARLYNENNTIQGALNNNLNEQRNELCDFNGTFAPLEQSKALDNLVAEERKNLTAKRTEFVNMLKQGTLMLLHRVLDALNFLKRWKEKQKLAQIGFPFLEKEAELASIDVEFGKLFAYISELRKFANWLIGMLKEELGMQEDTSTSIAYLNEAISQLNVLLRALLHQVVVVSQQPDPMQKTVRKINPLELHILAAEKLGIRTKFDNANIHFKIITEEHAKQLTPGDDVKYTEASGEISNAKEKAMLNKNQHMTVKFSNSKLTSVKRRTNLNSKGSQCSKKEQKYVLLFHCDPLHLENFGEINLWTLSLPVMVAVHGSQECELHAAIFWQRAFGSVDYREGVEDESLTVLWSHLALAIIHQFQSFTGSKRPLSQASMDYVAEKMLGPALTDDSKREKTLVTHARFNKECLNGEVKFSCWDWLFAIMQLFKVKEVLEFWDKGWLIGFISKDEAAEIMNAVNDQTFLLRFSDRVKGAVSIAYVVDSVTADGRTAERQTFHLSPVGIIDVNKISLVERLQGLQDLHYLYPVTSMCPDTSRHPVLVTKEEIVAHFANNMPTNTAPIGYTKAEIHVVVRSHSTVSSRESSPPITGRLCHTPYLLDCNCNEMEVELSSTDEYHPGEDCSADAHARFAWSNNISIQLPGIESLFGKKFSEEPMPELDPDEIASLPQY